ncbi:hypothetical protein PR002_g10293 [Phytophthora rubi]|uniref:DUF659 domain-containing protein n=1 Tax=Phytophthora rubi TaxID=129364 RepID=A0A6A3MHB5_9STRA|nr:hypothetical protein PR002_g10293 [Phytophthora rubi]
MTQEEFNKSVANYIYSSGLPLRTVEKPGFQTFSLKGLPAGLKVPSRQLVSGCLLFEAADEEVELFVEDMKDLPYIVLVIDGCTSVSHWKMMNYVIFGRNIKPVVWKIVVTEENSQTAEYIASVTMDVVNEVEHAFGKVGFVTGVMSDNVNAMQAACEILETKHGLICAGCGAHTLNLLLQDIAKLPTVKDVTEKAVRLATYFIFARKLIRAKFEKVRKQIVQRQSGKAFNQTLSLPAVTRWYSSYNCLVSVIRNKEAITPVFQDGEFMAQYKPKPKPTRAAGKRKWSEPQTPTEYEVADGILKDDNFWVQGKQVIKLLAPIIKKWPFGDGQLLSWNGVLELC